MIESSLTKPKILLVEDELLVQKVHRFMLEKIGCEVELAINGPEALKKTEQAYDLIFMDIGLPDITGLDVTKQIRSREKQLGQQRIPIVVLTAYNLDEFRAASQAAGVDELIAKPLKISDFEQLLNNYLMESTHER